ncbi:MAG: GNAT family N-acetyltransferase [Marinosulfonomonas sp.]
MFELRTNRLLWRGPKASDYDAMFDLVSDYEVVKWTGTWPYPADPELTRTRCTPVEQGVPLSGPVFLGETLIGSAGVHDGELGYMFAKDHWGHGYASEICAAILDHAFQHSDHQRIIAKVARTNAGSIRVLEKLGFHRINASQCSSVAQGKQLDSYDYALDRPEPLPTSSSSNPAAG